MPRAKQSKSTRSTNGEVAQGVASVERALSILESFRESEHGIPLAAVAERTGLYKSTILRLIVSLDRRGYVRKLESGDYQLGPMAMRLGSIYQQSFRLEDFVVPALQILVRETVESASFYVRDGEHRLCLFRADSPQAVRDHVNAGDLLPLNQGAGGHVLKQFSNMRSKSRPKELIVSTFGERQPDTAAVAAPVFGAQDRLLGALSVSGPKSRFTAKAVTNFSAVLRAVARDLTEQLGGDPGVFG